MGNLGHFCFCPFCFRRWIETCWSEWARIAAKAEIKCATGDSSVVLWNNKTSFCKLTTHQKAMRTLFSFSSRAHHHPLCSVCQHGRLQPRQTLVSMATRCRSSILQETRSVYLALCPRLWSSFTCITLTACRTQGGVKSETPRHLFPLSCPKKARPYDIHCHSTRSDSGAVWSSNRYFADSALKPVDIVNRRSSSHPEHF